MQLNTVEPPIYKGPSEQLHRYIYITVVFMRSQDGIRVFDPNYTSVFH